MKLKLSKKDIKANKGITLIALVITIIVLLILAGVTIVTLTGDNGLLQKAGDVRNNSQDADIEEDIRLAWNKVCIDSYAYDLTDEEKANALLSELSKNGYTDDNTKITAKGTRLIIENYRGKDKVLDINDGNVKKLSEVAKAKSNETIFNNKNTPLIDEFGNTLIIPKGFKIANDSAEVVTEGIVIEDATYADTLGSQFVWIPISRDVSEANKIKGTKNITILLSRYTFDNNGTPTNQGNNKIFNCFEEYNGGRWYGNMPAKTLLNSESGFVEKTNIAGGFWIGRYEARYKTINNSKKMTEVVTDEIYYGIKQETAALSSQEMYISNDYFESDLINSYAWDTATLFLQEYDNRENKPYVYSKQPTLNLGSPSIVGTEIDKICNVFDMAGNYYEWTTESSDNTYLRAVRRGGHCHSANTWGSSDGYTSFRLSSDVSQQYINVSSRPIIFLK